MVYKWARVLLLKANRLQGGLVKAAGRVLFREKAVMPAIAGFRGAIVDSLRLSEG